MAVKVAELFAELRLDARNLERDLQRQLEGVRRALERGISRASQSAGDELRDQLSDATDDSIDSMVDSFRGSRAEMERAGAQVGKAFAEGVSDSADQVARLDASSLSGSTSEFGAQGKQLGGAFADGVSSGARSVSAGIDPASLGGSRSEFKAEGEKLGDALSDGLESGLDGGPAGEAVGGFLDGLPLAMANPATAAGAAVAAAFVVGMEEGLSSEATSKQIAASLGLDQGTAEAATVGKVVSDLYADGWDRGRAAEAVQAVYSSIEESQGSEQALRDLSGEALNFSQVFGTSMTETLAAVQSMVSAGVVEDAQQGFDLLTQTLANAPVPARDEILAASEEYAEFFAGLGIDGPKAYGILGAAAERNRYIVDKIPDSLKEIINVNRDMSDATRQAYADVGLNADEMRAKILSGGPAAEEALTTISNALLGVQDPAARSRNSVLLFGTTFEEVAGSPQSLNDTLSALAAEGMTDFEGAGQRNAAAVDTMQAKIDGYTNTLKGTLGQAVGGAIYMVGGMFDDEVRDQWAEGWDQLNLLASAGVDGTVMDLLRIPQAVGGLPGMITEAGAGMWDSMTSALDGVLSGIGLRFEGMLSYIGALPGRIGEVAGGMWDGIKAAFRAMLQGIAAGWNGLAFPAFEIPAVNIPGLGNVGGGTIGGWDLPDITIPQFHTGGIVPGTSGGDDVLAWLRPCQGPIPPIPITLGAAA